MLSVIEILHQLTHRVFSSEQQLAGSSLENTLQSLLSGASHVCRMPWVHIVKTLISQVWADYLANHSIDPRRQFQSVSVNTRFPRVEDPLCADHVD